MWSCFLHQGAEPAFLYLSGPGKYRPFPRSRLSPCFLHSPTSLYWSCFGRAQGFSEKWEGILFPLFIETVIWLGHPAKINLIYWGGVSIQCSVTWRRAGLTAQICAAFVVLATPCHTHRHPSRFSAHVLACHLIQIKAGPQWVPSSALNSSCGKPLTLLHLVSNLNAFYISIYYVWTLKMSTRGGLFLLLQVNQWWSQPTESQDLMEIVVSTAKTEEAESQPEGQVACLHQGHSPSVMLLRSTGLCPESDCTFNPPGCGCSLVKNSAASGSF